MGGVHSWVLSPEQSAPLYIFFLVHGQNDQSVIDGLSASATVPLGLAFLGHAIVSRCQVNIVVLVTGLQVTHISSIAVKLDAIIASLSLDPRSSGPFANAPSGLLLRASLFSSMRSWVGAPFLTPVILAGVFPKASAIHTNLSTDPMSWIMIAFLITSGVTRARFETYNQVAGS